MTLTEFLLARVAEDERNGCPCQFVDEDRDLCDTRWRAECDAKRRIVESCREDYEYAQGRNDDTTELAEEVLWHLALPYADHPDYRDDWKTKP